MVRLLQNSNEKIYKMPGREVYNRQRPNATHYYNYYTHYTHYYTHYYYTQREKTKLSTFFGLRSLKTQAIYTETNAQQFL